MNVELNTTYNYKVIKEKIKINNVKERFLPKKRSYGGEIRSFKLLKNVINKSKYQQIDGKIIKLTKNSKTLMNNKYTKIINGGSSRTIFIITNV
jgi:hypothetical protein